MKVLLWIIPTSRQYMIWWMQCCPSISYKYLWFWKHLYGVFTIIRFKSTIRNLKFTTLFLPGIMRLSNLLLDCSTAEIVLSSCAVHSCTLVPYIVHVLLSFFHGYVTGTGRSPPCYTLVCIHISWYFRVQQVSQYLSVVSLPKTCGQRWLKHMIK